jgi:uncharacterized membrane protein YgcG
MKKFLVAVAFGMMAVAAQAEASFDQIQGLIQQHQYQAAASGLETIIQNHPRSAKAFYAMAQAQAGMGNLEKAQKALNIATGLNPTLDFAPASSVQSLKDAITPQVSKIEVIEESHTMRNAMIFLLFVVAGFALWYGFKEVMRKQEEDALKRAEEDAAALKRAEEWAERQEARRQAEEAQAAKEIAEYNAKQAAEAALKAHKNYGHERFDPANPDKLKTVKQFKEEAAEKQRLFLEAQERREAQARADAAEASARMYRTSAQAVQPTHTTVVQNSSNDMLTGVLIGNMLSNSGHHHDTERTVVRETVREVPAPSRDSSWDDAPAKSSSRSSSWDDDSSSKSSSSWSSSSSSSSSSWDSGSSSSDSSSSSSWD